MEENFINESYVEDEAPPLPPGEESAPSMANDHNRTTSSESIKIQVKPQQADIMEDYARDDFDELEASLPSHNFRSLRGLPSDNVFKKGMHKSLRRRREDVPDEVDGSRGFDVDNEEMVSHENQVFNKSVDLNPGEFANLLHRNRNIKEVSTTISRKRILRQSVNAAAGRNESKKKLSAWKSFKLRFSMGWQHFKDGTKEMLYSLDLWRGHLKVIQGKFGSGVLSYFVLLRWLFLLNVLITTLTLFFLFIPQIVYNPSTKYNQESFTGVELITGDGYFTNSEAYYGWYTNHTIGMGSGLVYKMPLAYLCVGGAYLLLCLAILIYSMAESYRDNYIYAGDEFSFYTSKVFCSWDYCITNIDAAKLKEKSIFNDLKEVIAEQYFQQKRTRGELCCLVMLRLVTYLLVLGMITGASFLIYYCTIISVETDETLKKLLLPIVVSGLNFVLPMTFRIIASLEAYKHPRSAIQISLARTALLKLVSLGMILVSLFLDVSRCRQGLPLGKDKCLSLMKQCWETYIGIVFYRLVIVDFVFLLLSSFFGEFIRRIVADNIGWCKMKVGPPGFDISRNVLDLVYAQSLCWIGTFFSPLLAVVNVIKLFVLFYVKRVSVTQNCRVSMRPFRAAKMNLLFLVLLAVAFLVSIVTVGYTVMSRAEKMMKPSRTCGPFRNDDNMYAVITNEVEKFPDVVRQAVNYVSSASFLAMLFCILGIVVYYYKMLKDSNEKKIKLLKEQIALAGQDKLYLMKKIKITANSRASVAATE
ncbi:transmembrane channel-like protein 7 isoform X2 [Nematostella vectensis]|uniref:transmembrane channel-like protein 7 isoform X2 n=1 Tax=Nematostella vectensis TaxID=45351 RepID=UPI0020772AB6|nr:transmembrane channel-like protein 7 isoform X2 [Nematostella vectensis]